MPLEAGTFINDLNTSNPPGSDQKSQGDDHLRLIKNVLRSTFPAADRAFYFEDYVAKTGAYTILEADDRKLIGADSSGGAFSLTLPTLLAANAGWCIEIVKEDTSDNNVTIVGTINDVVNFILTNAWDYVFIKWTGTEWRMHSMRSPMRVRSFAGSATLVDRDLNTIHIVNPVASDQTLTLMSAVGVRGHWMWFKQLSSTFATILETPGAETIDGEATFTLDAENDSAFIVSDGADWVLGVKPRPVDTGEMPEDIVVSGIHEAALAANEHNYNIGAANAVALFTSDDDYNITGFSNGVDGRMIFIVNKGTFVLTLKAQSTSSNAANRIAIPTDHVLQPDQAAILWYDDASSRWREFATSQPYIEYNLGSYNDESTQTQAHDLGRYPSRVDVYLECTTLNNGYDPGDRIHMGGNWQNPNTSAGIVTGFNETDVFVVCNGIPTIPIKAGDRNAITITPSSWDLVIRVWE